MVEAKDLTEVINLVKLVAERSIEGDMKMIALIEAVIDRLKIIAIRLTELEDKLTTKH